MLIKNLWNKTHGWAGRGNDRLAGLFREDGTSFIELLIAMAVFVLGLSALLGSMASLTPHRQSANARAQATNFASSTFEDLRNRSIGNILGYEVPVDNEQQNTVTILGIGPMSVSLFAVVPGGPGEAAALVELGSDDAAAVDVATLPNPIEIRAVMSPAPGGDDVSSNMQITASTMISY